MGCTIRRINVVIVQYLSHCTSIDLKLCCHSGSLKPLSFNYLIELYTRFPFISRHLRSDELHFTSFAEDVQQKRQ